MKMLKNIALFLLLPAICQGGVNLKNGNFYMTYIDVIVTGDGPNLTLARTYNSKSTDIGWFGFGWGSPYETRIAVNPDGSATIHENGSGAQTRFTPKGGAMNGAKAAQKILAVMKKKMSLTKAQEKKYLEELTNDTFARQRYAKRFNVVAQLPPNTTLNSNIRGEQKLHALKNGYKRTYSDGKEELFDRDGRLRQIKSRDGYTVNINYKKNAQKPHSIKDSKGKQIFFQWDDQGFAKHAWSGRDPKKKASYSFDGKNLKTSKDVGNNTYAYTWDSFHNMTSITYSDKSKMTIKYWPKTQFVRTITYRDGRKVHYKFESNPKNPKLHYWTTVTRQPSNAGPKAKKRTDRYEYEHRRRPDGSQYTYRIATTKGGIKTETTYSECCSLPLSIRQGNKLTTFKYKNGLLKKKTSNDGTFVNLDYDDSVGKISRVENNNGWTNFKYKKKGKLKGKLHSAENSQGMVVKLKYDIKGRIDNMVYTHKKSKKNEILDFQYGALGKPSMISMRGVGKMNVAYKNDGSIQSVKSSAGSKVADRVTQTFLSLLAIVKPAGVNLTI